MLVTGELFPSARVLANEEGKKKIPGETVMEGVEHLGQYVYEMTNAKVNQLREERGLPENTEALTAVGEEEGDEENDDEEQEPIDGFEAEEE